MFNTLCKRALYFLYLFLGLIVAGHSGAQESEAKKTEKQDTKQTEAAITFVGRGGGPIQVIENGETEVVQEEKGILNDPAAEALRKRRSEQRERIMERREALLKELEQRDSEQQAKANESEETTSGSGKGEEKGEQTPPPPGPRGGKKSTESKEKSSDIQVFGPAVSGEPDGRGVSEPR